MLAVDLNALQNNRETQLEELVREFFDTLFAKEHLPDKIKQSVKTHEDLLIKYNAVDPLTAQQAELIVNAQNEIQELKTKLKRLSPLHIRARKKLQKFLSPVKTQRVKVSYGGKNYEIWYSALNDVGYQEI